MDQIRPNRTLVYRVDYLGLNGPNRTKLNQKGKNGPNRTNMDRIKLLNIYNFYCIFRFIFIFIFLFFIFYNSKLKILAQKYNKFRTFQPNNEEIFFFELNLKRKPTKRIKLRPN